MKGYIFDEMTGFFDGGGKNILRGAKWGARGWEAEVSGEKSRGWGPPVHPHLNIHP